MVVESFCSGVVDLQLDGCQDPVAVLAGGLGDLDERGQPGAAGLGTPAVDELDGLVGVQIAGEDRPEALLEPIGPPKITAAVAELPQGGGLVVGEVLTDV